MAALSSFWQDTNISPVWVFSVMLVLNMVRWLVARSKASFVQLHMVRLAREIASLRKQAEVFNNPSTYFKCAKFQRLANAKEKELAALEDSKQVTLQDRINTAMLVLKAAFIVAVILYCWGRALLYVPPSLTWPLGSLLSFPHAKEMVGTGAVTIIPWVSLCDRMSSIAARVIFPEPRLDLRTRPLPTVQEEMEVASAE